MKITLYVLVDKSSRIYYTSDNRELIEAQKELFPNTQIVKLQGELNE